MKPAPFELARPDNLAEAAAVLARQPGAARLLAGGQSLGPMLNLRLVRPAMLVAIAHLSELSGVAEDADAVTIGAAVTHSAIADGRTPDIGNGILARIAEGIAYRAVRNVGTIGGSLCHADPAAEYPAVMLALDAQMAVASRAGMRTVAASDFFAGPLQTALAPDELLTGIRLPRRQPGQGFAFDEVSRRCGDFALIGVAAALTLRDGVIAQARIAICGLASGVVRAPEVERVLEREGAAPETIGRAATLAASSVVAQSDLHASADYRAHLIEVLTRRVVGRAFRDASPEGGVHG
jgi:aerobic carbon-monoxide dehydrogenase medium subunit